MFLKMAKPTSLRTKAVGYGIGVYKVFIESDVTRNFKIDHLIGI